MFYCLCLPVVVVQLSSHVRLSAAPRTAALQAPLSFTISQSLLKFMSIESVILSNHLILCCPFSFYLSQYQDLFQWAESLPPVTKILELQCESFQCIFRVDFLWDWLDWSPCSPRDSQESYPAPQFESIDSSSLSLIYGPTLTSVHNDL